MSEISRIISDLQGAGEGLKWIQDNLFNGLRGGPVVVTLGRVKRSSDQNAKLWPMLQDVATQVEWYGRKLEKEDWKEVFSAAWKQQDVVPGINGGFVVMGVRTSKMTKPEFSQLIEIIYAFGAEHSVKWSEKSIESFNQYREAR
jgi:hypothetical protein